MRWPGRVPQGPSADDRVYIYTGVGFDTSQVILHPDDLYVRKPGTQPFDKAWQGFQKENPLANLQYASAHPGMGPHVPGTWPSESPYFSNTMQWMAAKNPTVQKNPSQSGAMGPGLPWVPNPTAPTAAGSAYAEQTAAPWWRTALHRLGLVT